MKFKCLSAVFASSCLKTAQAAVWKQCMQTIRGLLLQEVSRRGVVYALGLVAALHIPKKRERQSLMQWQAPWNTAIPNGKGQGVALSQTWWPRALTGAACTVCLGTIQGSNRCKSTTCLIIWANNQLFPVQSLFFSLPGTSVSLLVAALFYKSSLARWQIHLLPESAALVSIYRSQPKSVLDLLWPKL